MNATPDSSSPASTQSDSRRFVVGIDLGTTNCAVAAIDSFANDWHVETFSIPQLVAAGQIAACAVLASFHYESAAGEFPPQALSLPWTNSEPRFAVGAFARDQGLLVPGRLVSSAKSWLCHTGVDRQADLLPWNGLPDVTRCSPVEISARYLRHIRDAWTAAHPDHPLEACDVVITLPASFDEQARDLTVKAAAKAGLPRVIFIEEPQAAFYDWIDRHRADWGSLVSPGQTILVCDVGGGTSDFTLIRVRQADSGRVQFHRVAVGDHLILGGDNLDMALAQWIEQRLGRSEPLEPRTWGSLVRQCRVAKETLLGDNAPEEMTLNISTGGSRLIGGGIRVDLRRSDVEQQLVDGFFPRVAITASPISRRSGFQEFGLPFAPDAAVTRYLAAFLRSHVVTLQRMDEATPGAPTRTRSSAGVRPDILLFNGGVFASPAIRNRVVDVLNEWFGDDKSWRLRVLEFDRLDQAVARGAAYYGMVRRGSGVRIAAGLARSYYLGVATAGSTEPQAVCLAPAGMEPGQESILDQQPFSLLVSQPVEFPIYVSSTRLTDPVGSLVAVDRSQLTPLPPLRTVLQSRKHADAQRVPVTIHARLTEIGTLDVWCRDTADTRTWRMQFDVRSATQTDVAASATTGEQQGVVDDALVDACERVLHAAFNSSEGQADVMSRLGDVIGSPRGDWPATLLRRMWGVLVDLEPRRRASAHLEARWLNLVGFCLRPGYGVAADDWRVAETRKAINGKLMHAAPANFAEWWVLWRRIAGGLTPGQQTGLADPLWPILKQAFTPKPGSGSPKRGSNTQPHPREISEMWRLVATLELLPLPRKLELGDLASRAIATVDFETYRNVLVWCIGRIGSRVPAYGPLNTVVPSEVAWKWLRGILDAALSDSAAQLAVMQLARRTDDRYRDLSAQQRETCCGWLTTHNANERFVTLVRDGGTLDREEQGAVFGESLPTGLQLP